MNQKDMNRETVICEEKDRLLSLSEKELLVEVLLELKRIEERIDEIDTTIQIYSN
ncbi:MAG: hypothetical protein IJP35_08485 [Clostridia bacterium]|nr:hypothetical protein [Clostridia bacterium]